MQVIEALQPDWCQCLCDSDTSGASSRKRVRKSVDRSLDFLDRVIELKEKSEVCLCACIMMEYMSLYEFCVHYDGICEFCVHYDLLYEFWLHYDGILLH